MTNIDWQFIGSLEGERLTGYVPAVGTSKSGVTIATGVDLSAQDASSLAGIPDDLMDLLSPYFGLSGQAAVDALAAQPLSITQEQADVLNSIVQALAVSTLAARYDAASAIDFSALPDRAQTVIASVSFQYGSLAKACPHFWSKAVNQDWTGCYSELMNFGDDYTSRRHKEAAYLQTIVPTS